MTQSFACGSLCHSTDALPWQHFCYFARYISAFFFLKIKLIVSPVVHGSKFRAFSILSLLVARNWNYKFWLSLNDIILVLNFLKVGQGMKIRNGVNSGTITSRQKMAIYKDWSLCRALYEISVFSFFCIKTDLKPLKEFHKN
jgi:hypothetical protein